MKLKTVHVPRGYDGLHLEIDGAIVNVFVGLIPSGTEPGHRRTRVNVMCDRYAGEPQPTIIDAAHGESGASILIDIPPEKA